MLTFTFYLNWVLYKKKSLCCIKSEGFFPSISLLRKKAVLQPNGMKNLFSVLQNMHLFGVFLKVIKIQVSFHLFAHLGIEVMYGTSGSGLLKPVYVQVLE